MIKSAGGFFTVFLTVFSMGARGEKRCGQEELLQRCSTSLPVLSSPEISFALTKDELDKNCIELQAGIRCINNFTENCMTPIERRTFISMYAGVQQVMHKLCDDTPYQNEYLKHAACVKRARPEYEMCSKTYEITLNSVSTQRQTDHYTTDQDRGSHEDYLRTVCCSFQEYLLCSEQTVQRACGDESAVFTRKFLKDMSSGIIKIYCTEYRGQECGLPNEAPGPNAGTAIAGLFLAAVVHRVLQALAGMSLNPA